MSAGTDASILGYGATFPQSNVNGSFVNKMNTNYAGNFTSNEIPYSGLFAAKNNVNAANSCAPWACYKGGAKKIKRKIKNISKMYRMTKSKKSIKHLIRRMKKSMRLLKSRKQSQRRSRTRARARGRSHSRSKRGGGYHQYMGNVPWTPAYSLGSDLSAGQSALANPPPYKILNQCQDNYNHFTGKSSLNV